jgi:hypothetical protein
MVYYLISECHLLNTTTPPVHLYKKLANDQQQNYYSVKDDDYLNDFKVFFDTVIAGLQQKGQLQPPTAACKPKPQVKIALIGTDQFLSHFLQTYIDIFKSQDLISTFKFYYVPYFNASTLGTASFMYRFLCGLDQQYMSLFGDDIWLNLDSLDGKVIHERIKRYVTHSTVHVPFQICEAMIITDDSPAQFIPFICDFRIGWFGI